MARYGDGELAVMSGRRYASETDIGNWTIDPNVNDASFMTLVQLMAEGFRLAAEHSMKKRKGDHWKSSAIMKDKFLPHS